MNGSNHFVTSGTLIKTWNEHEFIILIPSFILVLVVICIGIPGNIITICVYMKKMRRTASRIFILALAFCDLINCILTMPFEISIIVRFRSYDFPAICAIGHTLTYILNGISALLLCGIAVDRFRKICRPLKPVFTPKRVRFICIVGAALGVVFYIPGFILYGTRTVEKTFRNRIIVGKTCQISDKYKHTKLRVYIYGVWFLGTVSVMVVLIVMYSLIGKAVYRRLKLEEQRRRTSLYSITKPKKKLHRLAVDPSSETSCSFNDVTDVPRTSPREQRTVLKTLSDPVKNKINKSLKKKFRQSAPVLSNVNVSEQNAHSSRRIHAGRTTIMLFSVTIAYVLSFIPFMTIVVLRAIDPMMYDNSSDVGKSLWNIFLRSYVINCAVNPILYGLFNKDFRKKMWELLQKLCCF